MIKQLHLENFKGLKDSKKIDLKPLTLLCGSNSSGKSSIIQSLLMLKQTFESQSRYRKVVLNGQFTHLGSFINIIHNKTLSNEVMLKFQISPSTPAINGGNKKYSFIDYHLNDFNFGSSSENNSNKLLDIELGLKVLKDSNAMEPYVNTFNVLAKSNDLQENHSDGTSISLSRISTDKYNLKWKNIKSGYFLNFVEDPVPIPKSIISYVCPKCGISHRSNSGIGKKHYSYHFYKHNGAEVKASFSNLMPIIKQQDYSVKALYPIVHSINSLKELIHTEFSNLYYIGPLREEPARRYIHEAEFIDIGIRGENAPFILSIEGNKKISPYRFYNEPLNEWQSIDDDNLEDAVNRWLRYMGISEYELEAKDDIIRLNMSSIQDKDVKVTLADVGFGVSQILPILVEGLRIGDGQTLILEQPEIHLHPKLQMQLADFFVSMVLSGKRVLIETHSDHIVNRISRRILESDNNELLSKTNLLFFENIDGYPALNPVEIDSNRGIVNWPKGFFDQSADEKRIIIQKGIEKRKQGRM
ncbi:DUF3696 domain-containing protein [Methanococcoides burtonii]|uniref:AAA domain-containing protein n=1 Tax=Methanococcoides burtonii (strain DSM 6242 / NBRC 107633 / OCM 468 / ACE-M) TaxID=259564 RepID=Q12ZE3_METBU|nr:DUF3696 domain-containing protein [Methanococcoides burtonii]ABE51183.1 Hypothetical protein Mbur_0172 [Methanococcoides burtonii DSM 6242]